MGSVTDSASMTLPADHPGLTDAAYCGRRAAIAEVGRRYRSGEAIPAVHYVPEEDEVWRRVSAELAERQRHLACAEYLSGASRLELPRERVPQLHEVDARLRALTGFGIEPVAGLVPTREFYGALARRTFLSTQYVRHHSVPFYTPEPDIVHEIIGHANSLASPVFADLYERAGRASLRASTDAELESFSRVFWFSLEFGVVWEDGELRAYGAGLLSSYGEIETFRQAEIRTLDFAAMSTTSYDITRYQPLLFAAASFDEVVERLGAFFDHFPEGALR